MIPIPTKDLLRLITVEALEATVQPGDYLNLGLYGNERCGVVLYSKFCAGGAYETVGTVSLGTPRRSWPKKEDGCTLYWNASGLVNGLHNDVEIPIDLLDPNSIKELSNYVQTKKDEMFLDRRERWGISDWPRQDPVTVRYNAYR